MAAAPVAGVPNSASGTRAGGQREAQRDADEIDAAYDSATQLFDANITTLVTQTPEPTMEPLAKRHKVASLSRARH